MGEGRPARLFRYRADAGLPKSRRGGSSHELGTLQAIGASTPEHTPGNACSGEGKNESFAHLLGGILIVVLL
jgi:hypothetical protein